MTSPDEQQSTTAELAPASAPAPAIPDYLASPNAVLGDADVKWRYGSAPDYSKTRVVWAETKQMNHAAGSLPQLVENLVKNWEVEASFKSQLSDWRTIDQENYSFAINGGPGQTGEHMLKVGTYNAIIAPNEYYSPEKSDFASSHKTFKRMMPTFAWEVLEVYSGPPKVVFKWRHWGTMKNDYVGFNDKGEKVTAKAHGGMIDITGITTATVDDKVRLQAVDTYFDPLDMFRQIAPYGVVNKQVINQKVHVNDKAAALDDQSPVDDGSSVEEGHASADENSGIEFGNSPNGTKDIVSGGREVEKEETEPNTTPATCAVSGHSRTASNTSSNTWEKVSHPTEDNTRSQYSSSVTGKVEEQMGIKGEHIDYSLAPGTHDDIDQHLEGSASEVHPHPKDMEAAVRPSAGEAVVAGAQTEETRLTHEEMSKITSTECPFLMNRE
ncbi:hypothetical protein MBLNU459_g6166t1 [Dothideomycetes sp. NU459]